VCRSVECRCAYVVRGQRAACVAHVLRHAAVAEVLREKASFLPVGVFRQHIRVDISPSAHVPAGEVYLIFEAFCQVSPPRALRRLYAYQQCARRAKRSAQQRVVGRRELRARVTGSGRVVPGAKRQARGRRVHARSARSACAHDHARQKSEVREARR